MLDRITPVLLTYNEELNIGRTLAQLKWAREIVVVDSFSTDSTAEIAATFPQVRFIQRNFDTHADQWNFAICETGIVSDWVLALDADYVVPDEAIAEIQRLDSGGPADGYRASFRYCVWGKPLRGTLYPPVVVLFRRKMGMYVQDGHTQRLKLDGAIRSLSNKLLHDDRKPLSRWLAAQDRYMLLEAEVLSAKCWSELSFADRVRKLPFLAPSLVFANCYVMKGGILDGRRGLYYATQRMLAEALLSLRLIERRMRQI